MNALFENPASFGFPILASGAVIPTTSTVRDIPVYDIPQTSAGAITAAEAGNKAQTKGLFDMLPGISAALPGSLSLMDSPPSFIEKSQADGTAAFGDVSSMFNTGQFVTGGNSQNNGLIVGIVAGFALLVVVFLLKRAK